MPPRGLPEGASGKPHPSARYARTNTGLMCFSSRFSVIRDVAKYVKLPTGGGVPPPSPYVCEGTDTLCVAFPLMTKKANCRKG